MARPNRNQNKEKIAVANVKGMGAVDVCYIGGSTFELEFNSNQAQKPVRFNIEALETLVAKGQATIMNRGRFAQIKSSLLPDGSTATHNADGSIKSASDRTLEMLIRDGRAEVGHDGVPRTIDAKERQRREQAAQQARQNRPTAVAAENISRNASAEIDEDLRTSRAHREAPRGRMNQARISSDETGDEYQGNDGFDEYEDDLSVQGAPEDNIERADGRGSGTSAGKDAIPNEVMKTKMQSLSGDINGDGVVDEFDDFVVEEQKKNVFVMGILIAACCMSVFLFFFFHMITASAFHGEEIKLIPDSTTSQPAKEEISSEPQDVTVGESGDESVSDDGRTLTSRTDFDPETAVRTRPFADDEHKAIAVAIMQTVRQDYLDGNVNEMLKAINLDNIANQISEAYANVAKRKQSLTLPDSEELRESYKESFSRSERQHVVDRDPYASIFGGRIREVRQNSDSEIYIVMESIAGDHQRVCFKAMSNEKDEWTITNIMDAEGYATMIGEGELE